MTNDEVLDKNGRPVPMGDQVELETPTEEEAILAALESIEARNAWIVDFIESQAEMPNLAKTKTADAGTYSYDYTDLAGLVGAVRPILARHGLAFTQPYFERDGMVHLATRVLHRAGWVEDFGETIVPAGSTRQATGSIVTYLRRYSLLSIFGLAPEDDDGRAATEAAASGAAAVEGSPASARRGYPLAVRDCAHDQGVNAEGRCVGCGKPMRPTNVTDPAEGGAGGG